MDALVTGNEKDYGSTKVGSGIGARMIKADDRCGVPGALASFSAWSGFGPLFHVGIDKCGLLELCTLMSVAYRSTSITTIHNTLAPFVVRSGDSCACFTSSFPLVAAKNGSTSSPGNIRGDPILPVCLRVVGIRCELRVSRRPRHVVGDYWPPTVLRIFVDVVGMVRTASMGSQRAIGEDCSRCRGKVSGRERAKESFPPLFCCHIRLSSYLPQYSSGYSPLYPSLSLRC